MASPAIQQISSLSTPFETEGLTPVQAQVAAALAAGHTVTAAAQAAGLHRTTIHHWMRTAPRFRRAVQQAREHFKNAIADQLQQLSASALNVLTELLNNAETPAAVRLKTALAVLTRPAFPGPGWQLPADVLSPKERKLVDDFAAVRAEMQVMDYEDAQAAAS